MRMARSPKEICGRSVIDELWGEGYTIVSRRVGDPFDVPANIIPVGMAYQWIAKSVMGKPMSEMSGAVTSTGWVPVPADRHPGLFAPFGYQGDIEAGGCVLCEMPREQVDSARLVENAKAQKLVDDWAEHTGAEFAGHVRVGTDETAVARQIGDPPHAATKIPADMFAHISRIFARRDELRSLPRPENVTEAEWLRQTTEQAVNDIRHEIATKQDTAA